MATTIVPNSIVSLSTSITTMQSPVATYKKKTSKPVSHRPLSHGALGGIIGGLLFVIILVVILWYIRRQTQKKKEETEKMRIGQPVLQESR